MTDYTRYPTDILPLPQLAGHGYKRNSGIDRIPMKSGRTRNRKRFWGAPARSAVTFKFSGAQLEWFEGWVEHTIDGGAADFTLPFKTGSGLSDQVCRFISDPAPTCIAPDLWEVKADIEVDGLPVIDENTIISAMEGIDDAATTLETGLDSAVTDYVTPESN